MGVREREKQCVANRLIIIVGNLCVCVCEAIGIYITINNIIKSGRVSEREREGERQRDRERGREGEGREEVRERVGV